NHQVLARADDGVSRDHRLDAWKMQADMSRRVSRRMDDVNAAAVRQTLSSFDDMLDVITRRFLDRGHIELMRHHLEIERLLELLQSAGMIAVAMREHAKFQIRMLVIHVSKRIHNDIRIGV